MNPANSSRVLDESRIGGACGPSYPDSFWWSEGPTEEPGSGWCGQPVQATSEQADGMAPPTVGRNLTRADGGFAEQHGAPDCAHDAEQEPLRAIGAGDAAELPFERAALGITKEGLDLHASGIQLNQLSAAMTT